MDNNKFDFEDVLKNGLTRSIFITLIVNLLYVFLATIIYGSFIISATEALLMTMASILIAFIRTKSGLYGEKKDMCYNVYCMQLIMAVILIVVIKALKR